MLALIFDTETTGMLKWKAPNGDPSQPDIIQLCAKLSENGKIVSSLNLFVHGESAIEEEAFNVHRISRDMTAKIGVSRNFMCRAFQAMAEKADVLVGHNVSFDQRMMQIAMIREGGNGSIFQRKATFCTKEEATNVCRIPHPSKPNQFKWPTLAEAYSILVDPRGFADAHDAEADVNATHAVYNVLVSRTQRQAS